MVDVTSPATSGTVTGTSELSGNALPAGAHVHEFEIAKVIGEGGFSLVYLAFDHTLHRTVALKEYIPRALAGRRGDLTVVAHSEQHQAPFEAGMRSFINEARLLAQFDHPALVKVFRFWESNGTAYLAMPFYQGRTLKQILKEHPAQVDEAWLKRLLVPILDALSMLHAQRVYHRDISPDNILLVANDAPILLDFGAARRTVGDMTQAFTAILKPSYAPLEQYAEDPQLKQGPWTDIYALAAVLYAAIVHKPPPPSVARIYKDPLEPLATRNLKGFSVAFLEAIDRGLAVRPDDRIQSIAEFGRALGITGFDGVAHAASPGATTRRDAHATPGPWPAAHAAPDPVRASAPSSVAPSSVAPSMPPNLPAQIPAPIYSPPPTPPTPPTPSTPAAPWDSPASSAPPASSTPWDASAPPPPSLPANRSSPPVLPAAADPFIASAPPALPDPWAEAPAPAQAASPAEAPGLATIDASATTVRFAHRAAAAPATAAPSEVDDRTIVAPRSPDLRATTRPSSGATRTAAMAGGGLLAAAALVYLVYAALSDGGDAPPARAGSQESTPAGPGAGRVTAIPAASSATSTSASMPASSSASRPVTTPASSPAPTAAAPAPEASRPASTGAEVRTPGAPTPVSADSRPSSVPETDRRTAPPRTNAGDSGAGTGATTAGTDNGRVGAGTAAPAHKRDAEPRRTVPTVRIQNAAPTTRSPVEASRHGASDSPSDVPAARRAEQCGTLRTRAELGETLSRAERSLIERECR